MNHLNIKKAGNILGIVSVAFFLLCMAWGVTLSSPALKELHINILKIAYPGFSMSFIGALIGIVWAFVYGWLFGAFFAWLCEKICIFNERKSS